MVEIMCVVMALDVTQKSGKEIEAVLSRKNVPQYFKGSIHNYL